jgi:very-short-patch-repair endonuclease
MHPSTPDAGHQNLAWPDRAIAELANQQRTIITSAQLRGLGVAPRTIATAAARGRLHRVHHGVYSLVLARSRPRLAAEQAAQLAGGPRSVLSHHSAAALHGLRLPVRTAAADDVVALTVTGPHRRGPRGIVVHRTLTLHSQERHRVQGLPCTSIARTLVDLAPRFTEAQLEPLVDQALRRTSATKLTEAVRRHPGRPGVPRLRRLLDPDRPSAESWSRAEARLRAALVRAGVPAPESNVAFGDYVPDLLWREHRVAVEYDSEEFHDGRSAFHHDRTRHNDLTAQGGLNVLHITHRQITETPERVIVWVVLLLVRGGWGAPALG